MQNQPEQISQKKVIKLIRTPNKTGTPQKKSTLKSQASEQRIYEQKSKEQKTEIISRERVGLMSQRQGLLGQYYNNLEKTVIELEKARQFLDCYSQLR